MTPARARVRLAPYALPLRLIHADLPTMSARLEAVRELARRWDA